MKPITRRKNGTGSKNQDVAPFLQLPSPFSNNEGLFFPGLIGIIYMKLYLTYSYAVISTLSGHFHYLTITVSTKRRVF